MNGIDLFFWWIGAALSALFCLFVVIFAACWIWDYAVTKVTIWRKCYWAYLQLVCFPKQWERWKKKCEELYPDATRAVDADALSEGNESCR